MVQVESRITLLEYQLAVLLGLPAGQMFVPQGSSLSGLSPLPQTGVPAALLQKRPDIRRALYRLQAADQNVAAAIAERFPKISLGGGLSSTSVTTRDLFDDWLANLAANLVGPLIDGGLRRAEVDRARAAAGEAFQEYRRVVLEALKEVEDALAQERQHAAYLESLQEQSGLADQVVLRVRDYYTKGLDDYQRVLSALLSQQRLQRNSLSARLNLYEARIALCKALAGSVPLSRPAYAAESNWQGIVQ
jgi:outer membrane protein TolC